VEGVTADPRRCRSPQRAGGSFAKHRVGPSDWSTALCRVTPRGAEQPALAVFRDAGRINVRVERFGERVVARHVWCALPSYSAAVMRANEYVSVAISARSRRSRNVVVGIDLAKRRFRETASCRF